MFRHGSLRVASRCIGRQVLQHRQLSVLAIESSCDDSCVAVLDIEETQKGSLRSKVAFHETVTADTAAYRGIHPTVALESHHSALTNLVQRACQQQRISRPAWKPSLVAATRGPGMRSNLAVGLSVAKGLAVAWDTPFVGVHHMQAHALTPRLCWTLQEGDEVVNEPTKTWSYKKIEPDFPYLSVLVSGGHTMIMQSISLTEHHIVAETIDIAVGDLLDKAARAVLPAELLVAPYGRALEQYAFPNGEVDYNYTAPKNRGEEVAMRETPFGWSIRPPLSQTRAMQYSFSGLQALVDSFMSNRPSDEISEEERRCLAREVLRISFEHLASRIFLHLTTTETENYIRDVVVSGGVASNQFLRHALKKMFYARHFRHLNCIFPPVKLCTDNALMIAWTAYEMYNAGYTSSLDIHPLQPWSMDSFSKDGGVLGASGWISSKT